MKVESPIWFEGVPPGGATLSTRATLIEHLGIELTEAGSDYLRARMPVDARTCQPTGVLHGGASAALAETLASWAALFTVDRRRFFCAGQELNASHLCPARTAFVFGIARPLHLGRRSQVWEVRISDEADRLVCICRVTVAVLELRNGATGDTGRAG